jgi:hypothetical protein
MIMSILLSDDTRLPMFWLRVRSPVCFVKLVEFTAS